MNNNLETFLNSMNYVVNNVPQIAPQTYLEPIFNELGSNMDFNACTVKLSHAVSIGENYETKTSYGRAAIEIPLFTNRDDYKLMKLGIVIAVDKKEPIYKVAIGNEIFACTNLTLTGDCIEVTNDSTSLKTLIKKHIDNVNMYNDLFYEFKHNNSNIILNEAQINEYLGRLIIKAPNNLSEYLIKGFTNAVKNPNSVYYKETENNKYNLFNAVTQEITNKYNKGTSERITATYEICDLFTNTNIM